MRYVPIAIFASFALLVGSLLLQMSAPKTSAGESKPFPLITVESLDGNKPWKPELVQGHVSIINFFASWCQPCAEEMPELGKLKKQFPDAQFHGVAWNDKPLPLKNFLLNYRNPFDQVWLDKRGEAIMSLGIRGIPETFIIDAQGIVRYRLSGPLSEDMRKGEIGALIARLLTEAKEKPNAK